MMKSLVSGINDFFATSYHIKSNAIFIFSRLLSSALAILSYVLFVGLFQHQIVEAELLGFGIVMLFAVIALLPLQEFLILRLKNRFLSEYLAEDAGFSRVAHRKLDLQSLIRHIFPDMVKMSGSQEGKLGILDTRSGFVVYNYSYGRQRKIRTRLTLESNHPLFAFLEKRKRMISIGETLEHHDVNSVFVSLGVNYIIPFYFREKLFGFLAVTNCRRMDSLNLMARKAALAIHNYLLSVTVVDHIKYRKEFEFADKIQDLILNNDPPRLENIELNLVNRDPSILLEFFQIRGKYYFVGTGLSLSHKGSGLVLSYLLGVLFSRFLTDSLSGVMQMFNLISDTLLKISYRDEYCLVAGVISPVEQKVELAYSGRGIQIRFVDEVQVIEERSKMDFDLKQGDLQVKLKNCTVLEIRKKA